MTKPTQAQIDAAHRRFVDYDKLWALFVDHYWDSFARDRDLILSHISGVMMMAEVEPASPALTAAAEVGPHVKCLLPNEVYAAMLPKDDARSILCGLFPDGMVTTNLTPKAKDEIRKAIDAVLKNTAAAEVGGDDQILQEPNYWERSDDGAETVRENRAVTEVRAATIERCAQVVQEWEPFVKDRNGLLDKLRALKDKP